MKKNIPWEIILKKLKDEISTTEMSYLDDWLNEPDNRHVYHEIESLWNVIMLESLSYESQADLLWEKMESRMKKKAPRRITLSPNRVRLLVGAASVLLFTLLSLTGYLSKQLLDFQTTTQTYSCLNGKSKVLLPDGSVVWLNGESNISYSTSGWSNERSIQLNGEAFFDVAEDKDRPFIVRSNGFEVKVFGTTFNVEARDESDDIQVSLISGSVAVRSSNHEQFILPGEMAICTKNTGRINVMEADVELISLWARSSIRIEKKSIRELSGLLSKWYGVDIILDPSVKDDHSCTFTITNEPLEEILRLLSHTTKIKYSFADSIVRITK